MGLMKDPVATRNSRVSGTDYYGSSTYQVLVEETIFQILGLLANLHQHDMRCICFCNSNISDTY